MAKALKLCDDIIKTLKTNKQQSNELKTDDIKYDSNINDNDTYVMGLDCSTQSMTISLYKFDLNKKLFISTKYTTNINFDKDLKEFGTTNGYIINPNNKLEVTAPTLMFVKALDIGLNKLVELKSPFNNIVCISGSGQQHGSVYWKNGSLKVLKALNVNYSLYDNLKNCFAIQNGPIWMDSSTTNECRNLENICGGPQKLSDISGSVAYERFTGNQIAKIYKNNMDIYNNVERISLVSSFIASILVEDYANIDVSDGSGMNLLDIKKKEWSDILLNGTAKDLGNKLGNPVNSYDIIGNIGEYFIKKYGFNKDCKICSFSGDNPCTLAGLMVSKSNDICISLGTSDTLFALTKTPKPGLLGSVLCSPVHKDAYMVMLTYKNGSITREKIRDINGYNNWNEFDKALFDSNLNGGSGNNGNMGIYYIEPEITPTRQATIIRCDLNNNIIKKFNNNATDIRALIESQFIGMRLHSHNIGVTNVGRIIATGGASKNKSILKIMSDVFGCDVFVAETSDTATKGAALRALHGFMCYKHNKFITFDNICNQIGNAYIKVAEPDMKATQIYTKMLKRRPLLEIKLDKL